MIDSKLHRQRPSLAIYAGGAAAFARDVAFATGFDAARSLQLCH
jgi:hypothetical protein